MEKYGFVYIWYDRKRKMYYIGSHWGTEEDGYICSSNRMRNAHRRRPQDFKRRILSRVYTDRIELLAKEQMWFDRVKLKDRYYNLSFETKNPWWADPDQRLTVGEKISKANTGRVYSEERNAKISRSSKGKKLSEECKQKLSEAHKGKTVSDETRRKLSLANKGKVASEESRKRMSDAKKGKPLSPEQLANRPKTYKKRKLND